jgi:rhodanese-related sulfurtransferase
VPGAINIGLGGQFASWAGALIPINTPLIIVAETEEKVTEVLTRLARVGHESVKGFLKGGMEAWREAGLGVGSVKQISVDDLRGLLEQSVDLQVIDVRRPMEYADGHVPRALSLPLAPRIGEQAARFDPFNVSGGTNAWIKAGYAVE